MTQYICIPSNLFTQSMRKLLSGIGIIQGRFILETWFPFPCLASFPKMHIELLCLRSCAANMEKEEFLVGVLGGGQIDAMLLLHATFGNLKLVQTCWFWLTCVFKMTVTSLHAQGCS